MKKKVVLFALICIFMLVILCGCGSENIQINNIQNSGSTQNESGDYMEKYIKGLKTDADRDDFLSFWNAITSYCRGIEFELKEASNEKQYTFDPTDEVQIPTELKDLYDFSTIKFFKGYKVHKNFEMKINGKKVELSFDGEKFYPTTYGYTEVQNIIEDVNDK